MDQHTFVYVGKVCAEPRDGLQHCCPVWPIQRFDRLRVEILHRLFVASAHAVLRAGVPIEGIDSLGDSHL